MGTLSSAQPLPLSREPDFRRLWGGQAVSVLGSQVTAFALPVLAVVTLDADAGQLGLLRTLEFLPFVLLTLPVGLWLDRHRPRPAMLAANAVRAVVVGSVAIAGLLGALQTPWLYGAVLVIGAATVVFDVAYLSYLPALVRRDQLVQGNSHLAVSDSAAEVGGPGLAGLLVQAVSAPAALLVDAVSYLVSLLCLARIRTPDRTHHGRRTTSRDCAARSPKGWASSPPTATCASSASRRSPTTCSPSSAPPCSCSTPSTTSA